MKVVADKLVTRDSAASITKRSLGNHGNNAATRAVATTFRKRASVHDITERSLV